MSTAAVLAILIAAGEAQSPAIHALEAAAAEVVGKGGAVVVVEATPPTDAEALRVERAVSVRAVVQLAWRESAHLNARLRLHAARTDRWVDREITFSSTDTPAERGRTLGFAIASMLPAGDPNLQFGEPSHAAPTPEPAPALGRRAASLAILGVAGLGGPASGVGAVVNVEVFVTGSASLGVSLSGRWGQIAALDADELITSVAVGRAWWPVAPTPTNHLGLALQIQGLVLYHAVSHAQAGAVTEWKGQTLPGSDAKVVGTWRLARGFEILAGVGAEVAFGTVDVTVVANGPAAGAATIPALRGLAECGIRARF